MMRRRSATISGRSTSLSVLDADVLLFLEMPDLPFPAVAGFVAAGVGTLVLIVAFSHRFRRQLMAFAGTTWKGTE